MEDSEGWFCCYLWIMGSIGVGVCRGGHYDYLDFSSSKLCPCEYSKPLTLNVQGSGFRTLAAEEASQVGNGASLGVVQALTQTRELRKGPQPAHDLRI